MEGSRSVRGRVVRSFGGMMVVTLAGSDGGEGEAWMNPTCPQLDVAGLAERLKELRIKDKSSSAGKKYAWCSRLRPQS